MKKMKWILMCSAVICVPLLTALISLPRAYFKAKPECSQMLNPLTVNGSYINAAAYEQSINQLLKQKQPEDFRYFFKTFLQQGKTTYMVVNFRNQEYCFDARMKINNWDKLAGMRKTNGISYPEELYELTWKLEENDGKKELIYQDMHFIID
jgi:hypothetical protein